MTKVLSLQQEVVRNFPRTHRGSAFAEAVAGAGKTTTAMFMIAETTGTVGVMAYNKSAAQEFETKAAELGLNFGNRVRFGTCHSFGFGAWRYVHKNVKAGPEAAREKTDVMIGALQIPRALRSFVPKLVSLAKQRAIGLYGSIDDQKLYYDIIEHFDLDHEIEDEGLIKAGVEYAIAGLKFHKETGSDIIDFDDMIWLPVVTGVRMFGNDWIVGDEWQDANPARRALARKMLKPNGRALFIGDRCQPIGTKVTVPDGRGPKGTISTRQVSIEDLKVGDTVVSFVRGDSTFVQSGRKVLGVTKRRFRGELITVRSEGKTTRYTPNHYCYVQLKSISEKYCVYLMRKDNLWRIGTSLMQNGHGVCGPMSRKRLERADDVWVLKLFDTEREAKTYEFKTATEYGVPELLFRAPGSELGPYWTNTQKSIDLAWSSLDKPLLVRNALRVLVDHHRYVDRPLNETASKPGQFWVTRPIKMRACNLMSGMQVLHYKQYVNYDRSDFAPISVDYDMYDGDVFSLDVERDHSYVADNIATFNCQAIYGWTGADNDSIDQTIKDFNCIELPMTVTFRCPKAVVERAQTVVKHIEAHESAPEGSVTTIVERDFAVIDDKRGLDTGEFSLRPFDQVNDAVLCRNTKPLVAIAFQLIKRGIPCHVEGRDIGAGLIKLIERFSSARTMATLRDRMTAYKEQQMQKLIAKGKETQAQSIEDKVDTVLVIADSCKSIDELKSKIVSMFQDAEGERKPTLTLSTVHKSKGREWQRVFLMGENIYMPSSYARQDWQLEQERNLQYVAYTRAKSELVLVNMEQL